MVVARYLGMFNQSRNDYWVFGDRDSQKYLRRLAWTKIVHRTLVMSTASPDNATVDQ